MSDLRLQEELTSRLEAFARDQVLAAGDRACQLALTLLSERGEIEAAEQSVTVDGQALAVVGQSVARTVAGGTDLFCIFFTGRSPVARAFPKDSGLPKTWELPDAVATATLIRDETFSGCVDVGDRAILVAAAPLRVDGQSVGAVLCGQAQDETNDAMLGLGAIQSDIIALADRLQAERQAAVGEFLKSIRSIAKRIHLLALNASILSARAGEHGRGFAVVAREIGDLAERTRQSSQELEAFLGPKESVEPDPNRRRSGGRSDVVAGG